MKEDKYFIVLDDYEHSILIRSLNDEKTSLKANNRSTDALDDLLIKVAIAPKKKFKVVEREVR